MQTVLSNRGVPADMLGRQRFSCGCKHQPTRSQVVLHPTAHGHSHLHRQWRHASPLAARRPSRPVQRVTASAGAPTTENPAGQIAIKEQRLGNSHVRVQVTVPAATVKSAHKAVLKHLRSEIDMEGFRKGKGAKIPDSVLITTYGPGRVKMAVVEQILNTVTPMAARNYKDTALADSLQILNSVQELAREVDPTKDLTYTFGLDVAPELKWKTPYKNMRVEVVAAGDEASDAAAVEARLRAIRKEKASLAVVADRGLQRGDVAIVDFVAKRVDNGQELMGSRREGMQMDTDMADYTFMPGVVEGMLGMQKGEEKDVRLTIPETWDQESLRGVEIECHIKLIELFSWSLPEETDEWARAADPGSNGAADLRAKLLSLQKAETAASTTRRIYDALTEAVGRCVDVEVPESLVRQLGEQEYQTKLLEMQMKGKLTMEQVEQLATEDLLNNFIAQRHATLVELQKTTLGMEQIFQDEKLAVDQADIDGEFALACADFDEQGTEYDKERLMEQVVETMKAQKTLEWLEANNEVVLLAPEPSQ